jgi:hypothetical protein
LIKCIASIFIFSYTNLQSVDFSFIQHVCLMFHPFG